MTRFFRLTLCGLLLAALSACVGLDGAPSPTTPPESGTVQLQMSVGTQVFSVSLADSPAAQAFLAQLPLTITMEEQGGNEKFYYLDESLPTASYQPKDISAGDLMLYGSDCLVLFYESFASSYSYTRLGFVEEASELAAALGSDSVSITFEHP